MPYITKTSVIRSSASDGVSPIFDVSGKELPELSIPVEECDRVLGEYMRAWNQLETALSLALETLLETDALRATLIANTLQHAAMRDLIRDISSHYLSVSDAGEINKIMEEIKTLAGVRNRLVHGSWVHTLGIFEGSIKTHKLVRQGFVSDK